MPSLKRESICPLSMQGHYSGFHFSPGTKAGDTIWVSGQVGSDPLGNVGVGMADQARLAFENLAAVLEAGGANLRDVVDLMTFHTDFHRDIAEFVRVKDEFLPSDFPSWTAVGVTQLARAEYLVEIRAVAVVGSGGA